MDREERLAAEEYERHPPPPVRNADDSWETAVDNPYGIGDWIPEQSHPIQSLLYGPAYLALCWVAASTFFRSSREARRRTLLISAGLLVAFWIAVIGYLINPPEIFNDGILVNGWNPFFGPQLTLPLALFIVWLIAGWLPSASARSPGRVGKQ